MTRVIVHAGFHKTGTSSLQDYLRQNRALLAPHVSIHLKTDFKDAGNLARRYGLKPYSWRRRRFSRALRRYLAGVDDHPTVFLSWEGFSGVMPGHRRAITGTIRNFRRAGIPLARSIIREIHRRFGADADIVFLYTLREREGWIESVWGHIVRSIRLTDDFPTFRAGFGDLIHLDEEAQKIAAAIAPVLVQLSWLKDTAGLPQGPASAALDMFGLPEDLRNALPPAKVTNRGNKADVRAECLRLNRTEKDDGVLKRKKDALVGHNRTVRT